MRDEVAFMTREHITTLPDVKAFLWSANDNLGIQFDPAMNFTCYKNKSGKKKFNLQEIMMLEVALEECRKVCEKELVLLSTVNSIVKENILKQKPDVQTNSK